MLSVPLVFFRGYTAHEGLAVSIARTALETGDWLTPHMYNVRFVERPTLQSWIIAAISVPFGDVNQITARLPSVLFLLFGCAADLLAVAKGRRQRAGGAARRRAVPRLPAGDALIRDDHRGFAARGAVVFRLRVVVERLRQGLRSA